MVAGRFCRKAGPSGPSLQDKGKHMKNIVHFPPATAAGTILQTAIQAARNNESTRHAVTELERKGWHITGVTEDTMRCSHAQVIGCTVEEAQQVQGYIEGNRA